MHERVQLHVHTILQEKRAAENYDEVGQRSLERVFPRFTEDSITQATLSAGQSGIGRAPSAALAGSNVSGRKDTERMDQHYEDDSVRGCPLLSSLPPFPLLHPPSRDAELLRSSESGTPHHAPTSGSGCKVTRIPRRWCGLGSCTPGDLLPFERCQLALVEVIATSVVFVFFFENLFTSVFCGFQVEASEFVQFQSVQFRQMRQHKLDFKVRARHPLISLFESGDIGRDVLVFS